MSTQRLSRRGFFGGVAALGATALAPTLSGRPANKSQKATVQGMGLRRIRHTIELPDTPETRGMILKVRHLVTVQE